MPRCVRCCILGAMLLCSLFFVAGNAYALEPVRAVTVTAAVNPDGGVAVTEHWSIPDARAVEFLEYLVPPSSQFEITALSDSRGDYSAVTTPTDRGYRIERAGGVVYLEWQSATPAEEVSVSYHLTGGLTIHNDAVEWYWPVLSGGARPVSRVDATVTVPGGVAYLYAYGGSAGGVRVEKSPFRVSAVNIAARHSFEWRLLIPRSAMENAQGQPGNGNLAALRQTENARIASAMNRAARLWLAHWLLLLSPLVLLTVYLLMVRRFRPQPTPESLTDQELTAVSPAVVGWVYDSGWFDFASAQLLFLERQGAIRWEWEHGGETRRGSGDALTIRRVSEAVLSEADDALLAMFSITTATTTFAHISTNWERDLVSHYQRVKTWLAAVEQEVPAEWISRPSPRWAWGFAGLYLLAGIVSLAWVELLCLTAVAAALVYMGFKRRWLTPLGESHVARWVSAYYAAVPKSWSDRQSEVPNVAPEYMLAVEVGDQHLEALMGSERYEVVKELYRHLEPSTPRIPG